MGSRKEVWFQQGTEEYVLVLERNLSLYAEPAAQYPEVPAIFARTIVEGYARSSSMAERELGDLLDEMRGYRVVSCFGLTAVEEVLRELDAFGRRGALSLRQVPRSRREYHFAPIETETVGPEPVTDHFTEIELVDAEGQPVPAVDYELIWSNGHVRRGRLDNSGFARVEGLPSMDFEVSFPSWDEAVVQQA